MEIKQLWYSEKEVAHAFDRTQSAIRYWHYNGHLPTRKTINNVIQYKREEIVFLLLAIHEGRHNPCAIDVKQAFERLNINVIELPPTKRFHWKNHLRYSSNSRGTRVPSIKIPTNDHVGCSNMECYFETIAKLKPTIHVDR